MEDSIFLLQLYRLAAAQQIKPIQVTSVVEKYGCRRIQHVLETYGYSMLGVLVVKAEKDLPIYFAKEVTPADRNCYLHALQNQTVENMSVIPHLTYEQVQELNMDKKQLRNLWCKTGEGYFAGKWDSKINVKGNMSDGH